MPTLDQIEKDVPRLSKPDQRSLLEWLEFVVEDEREFTDAFKAKIEASKRDIESALRRTVHP